MPYYSGVSNEAGTNQINIMRTIEELQSYRNDLGHTDDEALCRNLDRLIAGDERVRETVEDALDQIEHDLKKYAGR